MTVSPADMLSRRFGSLTVTSEAPRKHPERRRWVVVCDCGMQFEVDQTHLRSGHTVSCGCSKKTLERRAQVSARMTRHGMRGSPTYKSWYSMIHRCECENATHWDLYGGRGISVCERWHTFENFIADMGRRPAGTTIDRYPNRDGNYEPGNCRWATSTEQNRNRRNNKLSDSLVIEIKRRCDTGETQRSIARDLRLSEALISMVRRGQRWRIIKS